jgi:hypothetical protein
MGRRPIAETAMIRPDVARSASAAALALALFQGPALAQQGRVFHVDYEKGSDAADGRTAQTAWKHAPGDPRSATAASLVLQPGDVVRFRPGSRYRGTFTPRAAGTVEAPVILDGGASALGSGAIIDGSDPLSNVRRCQSEAECLGNPNWRSLWRADLPATVRFDDWLFVNDQPLQTAQYPALSLDDSDDPQKLLAVPRAAVGQLQAGSITQPLPAGLDRGSPVLKLWVQPNVFVFNSEVRVSEAGLSFDLGRFVNGSFRPYTDRDSRFAIFNAPMMVNRPGTFALAPNDGLALFWPQGSAAPTRVSVGGRRVGMKLARASHIVVRGFAFRNFAGRHATEHAPAGITHNRTPGVTITGNRFEGFVAMATNYAAVHMIGSRDLSVTNNRFATFPYGSALIVDNTLGTVRVRCNGFSDIGRTGIRFQNVVNGEIRGNYLTRVTGVHGNAMSAYGDNRNLLIADNVVVQSIRPLTLNGANQPYHDSMAGPASVTIRNNVLISSRSDGGGITSYGRTQNLTIEDNFLGAPRFALKLAGNETGFRASGNRLVGAVTVANRTAMFDAAANQLHDPEGNGAQMMAEMERSKVLPGACSS